MNTQTSAPTCEALNGPQKSQHMSESCPFIVSCSVNNGPMQVLNKSLPIISGLFAQYIEWCLICPCVNLRAFESWMTYSKSCSVMLLLFLVYSFLQLIVVLWHVRRLVLTACKLDSVSAQCLRTHSIGAVQVMYYSRSVAGLHTAISLVSLIFLLVEPQNRALRTWCSSFTYWPTWSTIFKAPGLQW